MSFVTYAHTKQDGTIFYIGKGIEKRAYSKGSRNWSWQKMVAKEGLNVKILAHWKTEQEAFDHEVLLIECLKEMKMPLVNITNGGDGTSGLKWKQESKNKLSTSRIGMKFSKQHRNNIALARKGKTHNADTIKKMKEIRKNGTHNSRPIEVCGTKFQSITNFAKFVNKMPIWIKKCVDNKRVEKLEEYYKNAIKT